MASINFNPFESWFSKPPKPVPPLNLLRLKDSLFFRTRTPTKFASLNASDLFERTKEPVNKNPDETKSENTEPEEEKGPYSQMLDQFYWECENLPDYRYAPEVEKILNEDPFFETKENPTEKEIRENERILEELRANPVMKFLLQAEEIADKYNEMELKENENPYRREDRKLWRSVPHVIGLDGRPMPRKAIKTKEESDDKFWDFARQFFFGLWGFRQRPYPPGRPIDVAQAIGYKRLEQRYYDCKCLFFG